MFDRNELVRDGKIRLTMNHIAKLTTDGILTREQAEILEFAWPLPRDWSHSLERRFVAPSLFDWLLTLKAEKDRQDDSGNDAIFLTRELIHAGKSKGGGWNARQLAQLGISWPAPKGWLSAAVGRCVSRAAYQKFLDAMRG